MESAGRIAAGSEEETCTVPAYAVAVFPNASAAVTVTLKASPAIAFAGADTKNCVASPEVLVSVKLAGVTTPGVAALTV